MWQNIQILVFYIERFQSLHIAYFAIIFHSENVKYTHLLEQALPFQNKQIMWHLHHLGIEHLDSFIPLCFPLSVCFHFWMGTAESWVQHCWVFYQMDTQYESGLSFSQGPNVCVGLHIAYLETTQVP